MFTAAVTTTTTSRRPTLKTNPTPMNPSMNGGPKLLVNNRGQRGPVQWWAGIIGNADGHEVAGAMGVQRLPERLATRRRPYLLYRVVIEQSPTPSSAEGYACLPAARQISIRIARTMHVARGAATAKPPFAPSSR
jgi:hypothetical protein